MKNPDQSKKEEEQNEHVHSNDHSSPDIKSDKTGADNEADKTVKKNHPAKSKLEVNPDSTGIDTEADKTKKES